MDQTLLNLILTFKDKETALSTLGILKDSIYLNTVEKQFLEDYTVLLKSISNVPNRELLIQKFPNIGFEFAKGYAEETLLSNVESDFKILNEFLEQLIKDNTLSQDDRNYCEKLLNDSIFREKEISSIIRPT